MAEVLVPADDEAATVTELAARLSVHVGTRIPRPRGDEFVRVLAVGGIGRDLVTDSPTLVVEGFAIREGRARELCALALAHLQAAGRSGSIGGVTCYGVRVVSLPTNLPMPSVPDMFRFTATVTADLRRAAV
ncbi:hypothetical protein IT882_13115 [Microbacterium schleiferi]|uniref:Tail terminator n=1 Tax=Microbacterium schleiferi TaxID=69362 RepID=A0A7S8RHA1_9MICO|nr:hypothetical protein [Microbacterium schleiferi]QPE04131.1 hypothetical protein IT882_13115 [Microbacterium schleiferi]